MTTAAMSIITIMTMKAAAMSMSIITITTMKAAAMNMSTIITMKR